MAADPSVSPADTIPYADLRLEVEGAVQRGDEYQPVSVTSLIELLDAYERSALLAVGERDKAEIERWRDLAVWRGGHVEALKTLRERDRRQIEQLTERLQDVEDIARSAIKWAPVNTKRELTDMLAAAVLAGKEDADNG